MNQEKGCEPLLTIKWFKGRILIAAINEVKFRSRTFPFYYNQQCVYEGLAYLVNLLCGSTLDIVTLYLWYAHLPLLEEVAKTIFLQIITHLDS